ncbi:MAG: hypothetical protein RL133_1493 [Pseudomonadota bacterium]
MIASPWRAWATGLTLAMIIYGVAWEGLIDPIRTGSWLWLKVAPLALALPGLWRGKVYTYQWMSLLVWLYVCEALVRILGMTVTEQFLALGWLVQSLSLTLVVLLAIRACRRQTARGDSPSHKDLRH